MPAKNKRQQRLFGMALAYERGKLPKSKASKKVKAISKGMSEEEIEEFAKTKHKGLKENRALSFRAFLNEAYVDAEGSLRDLEFTPEEQAELDSYDDLSSIRDFLEESGAYGADFKMNAGIVTFSFYYAPNEYELDIDLDNDRATLLQVDGRKERDEFITVFDGTGSEFFELLKYEGFGFLD